MSDKKGTVIGEIVYRVNGERIISYEVVAGKTVKERTLLICAEYLRRKISSVKYENTKH